MVRRSGICSELLGFCGLKAQYGKGCLSRWQGKRAVMVFWEMGANTLAQGNLIYNKRLGKYGPIKAFMVRYLHYRSGYKDAHLTMDRRGGLEHTSVAQTRIHTAFHVKDWLPYCFM